jgi:hypothetical protein
LVASVVEHLADRSARDAERSRDRARAVSLVT